MTTSATAEFRFVHFLRGDRVIGLVLFSGALLWTPVATLNFFGVLTWLSPAAALLSWLCSFVLGVTHFVAGRWEVGQPNGRAAKASDDLKY